MSTENKVTEAAEYIKGVTNLQPVIGVVCGSGLGKLAAILDDGTSIKYDSIPNFLSADVEGHDNRLVLGVLHHKDIAILQGRSHQYEGHDVWQVGFAIRVLKKLGVKILVLTCAVGGLNQLYKVGDFTIVKDHISIPSLSVYNPLLPSCNDDAKTVNALQPVAVTSAYDLSLRVLLLETMKDLGFDKNSHVGIYCTAAGPSFPTYWETVFMREIGGDIVGMSISAEVTTAALLGIKVVVCSVITDVIESDCGDLSHEQVLENSAKRTNDLTQIIAELVKRICTE